MIADKYSRTLSTNMDNILCGCNNCNDHGATFHGILDRCLRVLKYENDLWEKGISRLEGKDVKVKKPEPVKEFKPASQAQIDGWIEDLKKMKEFYETPEGKAAWETRVKEEAAEKVRRAKHIEDAIKSQETVKFDVLEREKWLNERVWPDELQEYMQNSPTWIAYMHYGKEQNTLLASYLSLKDNIKTNEDYDKAEKAYKALLNHINQHGDLIRDIPKHSHKKPVKTVAAPTHVGRRAARRALQVERSATEVESD